MADANAAIPWITSPMETWNEESDSFSPRHEASTLELFFDLFFVANLATFTQYHAITNRYHFWSYIAFFILIWTTWFHVVCFDVRFVSDSVFERASKLVHFCTFAGFALVGYKFNPVAKNVQTATPHWIYRLLCWALFASRLWLGLQYLVTAIFCSTHKNRHLRLKLPLMLNAAVFLAAAVVYGSLSIGFSNVSTNLTGTIIGLYAVVLVELVGTLGISCVWQRLSFSSTHVGERLGLLGLIIIGEGVIGTTKTITRIMGRNGVYFEGCALIFCLVLILLFIWILYFDNLPRYKFGIVKQQFWMALHLPFHASILGVVEGSQQIALARNIFYNAEKLIVDTVYGCYFAHLDGEPLAQNLTKAVNYFKINETSSGKIALKSVFDSIYIIGNETGICSPENLTLLDNQPDPLPLNFYPFLESTISSLFQAFGLDLPPLEGNITGLDIAARSWRLVYTYYYTSIVVLLVCLTTSALLADKGLSWERFKWISFMVRAAMVGASIVLLVMGLTNSDFFDNFIASAWVLPSVVLMLWICCLGDRMSKWGRRRKGKMYEKVALREVHD
ncbi:hypothetical protein BDV95DRAFT_478666 [Massariosphaeria phaeospora]|uniref:Bacterial low temperature requirement A protein-domain-containing protein n=1 Tax=Massariosphaeria phaeospora TaxID=100035 RepID=A0A7C8IN32_9PLEO|nr:hypothetical protein BDV95DRAFT_478666 [Massariosphaeria phaeospora]